MTTANLDEIRDTEGTLPSYAWPGGYPILYLDRDNSTICPDCANGETNPNDRTYPVAYFIHYEGPAEFCEDCGAEVESAYGDPNDPDAE